MVVPIGNGFGLAGIFADVLDRGVANKDGLQVDLGPPSQQDRFGVMTAPRVLASGRGLLA